MNLSIGLSPCPNDTFIFHALLHGLVAGPKVTWTPHMEDVETLNRWAVDGRLDVTKLSFFAYAACAGTYELLDSGAALGFGCGPLVITRPDRQPGSWARATVAIPGDRTTAAFLFRLAFPEARETRVMPFSRIEDAVLDGEVDAGVIIHENRFTYGSRGLVKVMDLGEFWEERTGSPIPLGGIAIRRSLDPDLKRQVGEAVAGSVRYAWDHPGSGEGFIRCHAQEMDPDVIRQHIDLYVNAFSEHLGDSGRTAVRRFYREAVSSGILSIEPASPFGQIEY